MKNALVDAYRFYFLVDVSASMRDESIYGAATPAARLDVVLPALVFHLGDSPSIADRCWINVITFSDVARVHIPTTAVNMAVCDPLPDDGIATDVEAAFRLLQRTVKADDQIIDHGLNRQWFVPLVYFLSDGAPYQNNAVQPELAWLTAQQDFVEETNARIVSLGIGKANEQVLCRLATAAKGSRLAFLDDHTQNPTQLMQSILKAILGSVRASMQVGELVFDLPGGMRQLNCAPSA